MNGNIYGQCDFSLLPDGDLCTRAKYLCGYELHGYSSRLPENNQESLPWVGLCDYNGSAENMVWFAFTPCAATVSLRITPSNCDPDQGIQGIQAGLYRRCGQSFSVDCSEDISPAVVGAINPFVLTWDGFVPGRTAYLVIDGMAGEVCDFTIEVIEGVDTTPAVDVDASTLQNGFVVGPSDLECNNSGDTVSYSMVLPSCLMNYAGGCFPGQLNILDSVCFVWNVDQLVAGQYFFVDGDSVGPDVKIVFLGKGNDQFRVSVDVNIHPYYGGGCAKGACGSVQDLMVTFRPDEVITEIIEICPGESLSLCNETISSPGIYECVDPTNSCRTLRYDIRVKPMRIEDKGIIYQCSGDFYEFQGTRYYNSGVFTVLDEVICDLIHRFEVQTVVMNVMVQNGIRQLDCTNESVVLQSNVVSDFPNDVKYEWLLGGQLMGTSANLVVNTPGRYIVRAFIDNNLVDCESSDYVDININKQKPSCTFLSPVLNCRQKYGAISFTANSPLTNIVWSTPLGNTVTTQNFPIDSLFASSGISCRFQARRIDNGCTIDTLVTVASDFRQPSVTVLGDGELNCLVQKIVLEGKSDMLADSIRWIRDGNFLVANSTTYDATVPGNYSCWVRANRNGCSNINAKSIDQDITVPTVELGDDLLWYCNTKEINLNPVVDRGTPFVYQWTQRQGGEISGSLLDPDVVISKPGQFYLKVNNKKNGCEKSDSLQVLINQDVPDDIEVSLNDPLCFGDLNGSIQNIKVNGGFDPYIISVNGKTLNQNEISLLPAGSYEISVRDKYDCEHKEVFDLVNPELLTVEPLEDVSISFNETSSIEVITNYDDSKIRSITWRDSKGNIVGTGNVFLFDQFLSQSYEVEVINLNGCVAKTRVNVIVDNEVKFIISNALKIGGYGGNDKLVIKKNNIPVQIQSLVIYDRWGNKVFDPGSFSMNGAETLELEWNSTINGEEIQQGVYMLFIQYKDHFGKQAMITTDLTVIK